MELNTTLGSLFVRNEHYETLKRSKKLILHDLESLLLQLVHGCRLFTNVL